MTAEFEFVKITYFYYKNYLFFLIVFLKSWYWGLSLLTVNKKCHLPCFHGVVEFIKKSF